MTHTCHDCEECAAIPRPPELDMEKEISKLHGEGFLNYHPVTGNVSPLDYGRVAQRLKKARRGSAKASGIARDKARDRVLEQAAEWAAATPNPPLFLPYTFLESVLYLQGGHAMSQLRANACGGYKGHFVYYGQALGMFQHRLKVLTGTVKGKGRPPTPPLLSADEWPWKTPPIGIDPDEIMPAGWNYSAIIPEEIGMLPKWPNTPPKSSEDWNGIKGEPGVLRSHIKAIRDYLDTPHGKESWKTMLRHGESWTINRWAADVIIDYCLKQPYKPFPHPTAEEARVALTEGRMVW